MQHGTVAHALTRNALQERMQEENDVAVQVAASTPTPTLTVHTLDGQREWMNELNEMDESDESNHHTHTHE